MADGIDRTAGAAASRPTTGRIAELALVFIGGAAGSLARFGLAVALGAGAEADGWPLGTLAANLTGAFLLGLLVESLGRIGPDAGRLRSARLLLGTGVLGGFTTYSMFATEVAQLLLALRPLEGLAYALVTLVVGGAASWAGVLAARGLARRRGGAT